MHCQYEHRDTSVTLFHAATITTIHSLQPVKATSSLACVQYIVHPSWITDSVAAGRRLAERSFSLMSQISQGLRDWEPLRSDLVPCVANAVRFSQAFVVGETST